MSKSVFGFCQKMFLFTVCGPRKKLTFPTPAVNKLVFPFIVVVLDISIDEMIVD